MMRIQVEISGERVSTGRPEAMFADRFLRYGARFGYVDYAVLPDGRFLMIQPAGDERTGEMVLVQNWRAKLERMFAGAKAGKRAAS